MTKEFAGGPMHLAIWLFYPRDHTHDDIAAISGTSRQTVAGHLNEGRRRGLPATALDPDLRERDLSAGPCETFSLAGTHVVPTGQTPDETRLGAAVHEPLCCPHQSMTERLRESPLAEPSVPWPGIRHAPDTRIQP